MAGSEKPSDGGKHIKKKISGHTAFKGDLVGRDLEEEKENSRKEIKKKRR